MEIKKSTGELNSWLRLLQCLKRDRKLFVWGTGRFSKELSQVLEKNGLSIAGYIDSHREKVETKFRSTFVFAPDDVIEQVKTDVSFIVIASGAFAEIAMQCEHNGLREFYQYYKPLGFQLYCNESCTSNTIQVLGKICLDDFQIQEDSGYVYLPEAYVRKNDALEDQYVIDSQRYRLQRNQMVLISLNPGKVGSSTLYHSLSNLKSPSGSTIPFYNLRSIPLEFSPIYHYPVRIKIQNVSGLVFRRTFEALKSALQWKFINAVREPIAWGISTYYQNCFETCGHPDESKLTTYLAQCIPYYVNFCDEQYRGILGVDLYAEDFDPNQGYSIVQKDSVSVLTYRLDRLDKIFQEGMEALLGINDLKLRKRNIASEKTHISQLGISYPESYQKTKEAFRLPRQFLDPIYSSSAVTHFFTAEEIEGFYDQWAE